MLKLCEPLQNSNTNSLYVVILNASKGVIILIDEITVGAAFCRKHLGGLQAIT